MVLLCSLPSVRQRGRASDSRNHPSVSTTLSVLHRIHGSVCLQCGDPDALIARDEVIPVWRMPRGEVVDESGIEQNTVWNSIRLRQEQGESPGAAAQHHMERIVCYCRYLPRLAVVSEQNAWPRRRREILPISCFVATLTQIFLPVSISFALACPGSWRHPFEHRRFVSPFRVNDVFSTLLPLDLIG